MPRRWSPWWRWGEVNTRERDFADVLLLTNNRAVDAARLSQAVTATAAHRQTTLRPRREVIAAPGTRRQADWQRYLTRVGLADKLPEDFVIAIRRVAEFADLLLSGNPTAGQWDPRTRRWT